VTGRSGTETDRCAGVGQAPSATMISDMENLSRREFIMTASAATVAVAVPAFAATHRQRVFVGSNTPNGILAYDWDPATAELTPAGVAAKFDNVDWITFSPDGKYLFAAAEVNSFNGKPTGAVASYRVEKGALQQLSAQNSVSTGTCHVALDRTGRVLLAADYFGGSAASFLVTDGKLSTAVWSEHYTEHGPDPERQPTAHAHFASFSPDNRFAFINDLGGDRIHIYSVDTATAKLTAAGTYKTKAGAGPRTLHFHPNGHTAYSFNEMASTVDVLEWNKSNGLLTLVKVIQLLPEGYHGPTGGCDTVISKNGKDVYFANRGDTSLYHFHADLKTGGLTLVGHTNCGGKTPRNFVLDPTERWMLVANQDSSQISVFARNPETGALANEGKSFAAATPMCILFS
jgi:6-phosphogluconolactonase